MAAASAPVCRLRLGSGAPEFSQLTAGFALLHARGALRVIYEGVRPFPAGVYPHSRVAHAVLGEGAVLAYDLAQGYGEFPDPQAFDRQLSDVAYYFKRGCDRKYHNEMKNRRKVRPLGPPLLVTCAGNFYDAATNLTAEDYMSHNSYPDYKAHFVAGLFDPARYPEAMQDGIARVNTLRIESISACREAFGERFYGGLLPGPYARQRAPALVLPTEEVRGEAYRRRLRENYVCAATAGPLGTLGQEVAQFAAAGRAIVTTPPQCALPGEFARGKNYAAFSTPEECVAQLRSVLRSRPWIHRMEAANFSYFCAFVRPQGMVLHTLREAGVL